MGQALTYCCCCCIGTSEPEGGSLLAERSPLLRSFKRENDDVRQESNEKDKNSAEGEDDSEEKGKRRFSLVSSFKNLRTRKTGRKTLRFLAAFGTIKRGELTTSSLNLSKDEIPDLIPSKEKKIEQEIVEIEEDEEDEGSEKIEDIEVSHEDSESTNDEITGNKHEILHDGKTEASDLDEKNANNSEASAYKAVEPIKLPDDDLIDPFEAKLASIMTYRGVRPQDATNAVPVIDIKKATKEQIYEMENQKPLNGIMDISLEEVYTLLHAEKNLLLTLAIDNRGEKTKYSVTLEPPINGTDDKELKRQQWRFYENGLIACNYGKKNLVLEFSSGQVNIKKQKDKNAQDVPDPRRWKVIFTDELGRSTKTKYICVQKNAKLVMDISKKSTAELVKPSVTLLRVGPKFDVGQKWLFNRVD